jgi:hypothetical protein
MAGAKVRMQVNKVWIEVDSMCVKDAIQGISEYAEFFGEPCCGVCQGVDLLPSHRTAKARDGSGRSYDFYELVCRSCKAKLSFGQHLEGGTLFPRRKDRDENELPANGWQQWERQEGW